MNPKFAPRLLNLASDWISTQLEVAVQGLTGDVTTELELRVKEMGHRFHEAARSSAPILRLRSLGFSETELAALLTLAVAELNPIATDRFRMLGPVESNAALSRFVYGVGLDLNAFQELGPNGRLARFGLVDRVSSDQAIPECRHASVITRRALSFLLGDDKIDVGLSAFVTNCEVVGLEQVTASEQVKESARDAVRENLVVLTCGLPGVGRRTLVRGAAVAAGFRVLEVDATKLAADLNAFRREVRAVSRECLLLNLVPLFQDLDALSGTGDMRIAIVEGEFAQVPGPFLATIGPGRTSLRWSRPTIVIEMGQPSSAQRATLWHCSLGQGTAEDAQLLAERYPLAPALIVRASEAAKARANGRALEPDDIYAGIRSVLEDRLGQFAKRVTVTQTWDDLVLPPDQLDTIVELMARVRGRTKVYEQWGFAAKVGKGLGVSALFSGPPGTGKTMVAALIARDLGLELYQVDMGKVVSKFIGETEKNLGALFDAAEAGHAILLFDEADALFGKRTDVKSSNDRYANLETNYLLQRLESFTGICLLTTNHDSHIDPAFQRRLSLHLRFELPDVEERAQLWRATLPIAAPLAGNVDFASLARRYAMSGGYIRNAALRAAFLAADEDSEITAAHLERAARVEYEGMGKIAA